MGNIEWDKIICGDHVEILRWYPDNCFDMFLTSPPYDSYDGKHNLRNYDGYEFQFEPLAQELYRILKPGGTGVWIVDDMTVDSSETLTSFKQVLYFVEIVGFKLNDTMIYAKSGARYPVGYHHTKYGNAFEYMFCLSKGKVRTFHQLRDRVNTTAGKRLSGTRRLFNGNLVPEHATNKSKFYTNMGARTNVWTYHTGFRVSTKDLEAFQHPAIFPEKLAEDHILSWSNPGDVVIDPMCGSGTTCLMALKHQRHYVGIDVSEDYCRLARRRIEKRTKQVSIFDYANVG